MSGEARVIGAFAGEAPKDRYCVYVRTNVWSAARKRCESLGVSLSSKVDELLVKWLTELRAAAVATLESLTQRAVVPGRCGIGAAAGKAPVGSGPPPSAPVVARPAVVPAGGYSSALRGGPGSSGGGGVSGPGRGYGGR